MRYRPICRNIEYARVYRRGKSYVAPQLVLYVCKNRLGRTRVGFTATKKVGHAVQRNRARRVMRAAAAAHLPYDVGGYDLIFVARAATARVKSTRLEKTVVRLLTQAGLVEGVHGKGGGYRLSRPAKDYTAFEILSLTEGTLAPVTCLESGQQCENAENCRTLPLWQGLDRTIAAYLGSYTLEDLARMEKPLQHAEL